MEKGSEKRKENNVTIKMEVETSEVNKNKRIYNGVIDVERIQKGIEDNLNHLNSSGEHPVEDNYMDLKDISSTGEYIPPEIINKPITVDYSIDGDNTSIQVTDMKSYTSEPKFSSIVEERTLKCNIDLAWEEGVNVNNFCVPKEVLAEAILKRTYSDGGKLNIPICSVPSHRRFTIDPNDVIGYVTSIDLDNTITEVNLKLDIFNNISSVISDYVLGLDYNAKIGKPNNEGHSIISECYIMNARLIKKELSSYKKLKENKTNE